MTALLPFARRTASLLKINRRSECFFDAPTCGQTMRNDFPTKPCYFRPFGNQSRFSVEGNSMKSAPISRLLLCCCPSAVAWFVISIAVQAINGVFGRWFSAHVFQKIDDRCKPSFANPNAAPTVIFIVRRLWIVATLFHPYPRRVFGGWHRANYFSMFSTRFGRNKYSPTSAAFGPACNEKFLPDILDCLGFARTTACPQPVPARCPPSDGTDDLPSTKSLADEIFHEGHCKCFRAARQQIVEPALREVVLETP
jgi:hypothetical protein